MRPAWKATRFGLQLSPPKLKLRDNLLYSPTPQNNHMLDKIKSLKSRVSQGVSPAMSTPFETDRQTVHVDVVPDLVAFLMEKGTKGLFVSGTTGEGILTDLAERKRLFQAAVPALKAYDGVSMLHVGTNNLRDTLDLISCAAELDADSVAILPGFFYGLTDAVIFDYFKTISATFPEMPMIGYDIPHLAVNGFTPSLLAKLCAEIPNFAGLKCSRTDALKVRGLIEALDSERFILTGNERMAAGLLALGANGIITGLSTAVPEPFVALCDAMATGDLAAAQKAQGHISKILDLTPAGERIGFMKQILTERGIPVGEPIPPRPASVGPYWPAIQAILAE